MDFSILDRYLDSLLHYGVPMYDCTVHVRHEQVYRRTGGFTNVAARQTHEPGVNYFLYSCSKTVTTAAALMLFEAGKFRLTDPLSAYLPEFSEVTVRETMPDGTPAARPAKTAITVRDLFTMTAGFHYNLNCAPIKAAVAETGGRAPTREVVRALAKEPLLFDPGAAWHYGLCHDVLAALVEEITGHRFSDYVREKIFLPLGMTNAGFRPQKEGMAAQYRYNDMTHSVYEIPCKNSFILGDEYDSGGAGIVCSAEEFILFADAMANGGVGKTGARILTPATVDLWRTNALTPAQLRTFNWPQYKGYGYGLGVRTLIDPPKADACSPVGECGWNGAAGSTMFIVPETGVSVFLAQHTLNLNEEDTFVPLRHAVFSALIC